MELTTKEAAEDLGVGMRQIQNLIKKGRLKATRRGRDWFIKKEDLEAVRERPITGRPKKKEE